MASTTETDRDGPARVPRLGYVPRGGDSDYREEIEELLAEIQEERKQASEQAVGE